MPSLSQCPDCGATFRPGAAECPECGLELTDDEPEPENAKQELERVLAKVAAALRRKFTVGGTELDDGFSFFEDDDTEWELRIRKAD